MSGYAMTDNQLLSEILLELKRIREDGLRRERNAQPRMMFQDGAVQGYEPIPGQMTGHEYERAMQQQRQTAETIAKEQSGAQPDQSITNR
jgi:hypothetical protein